MWLAALLLAGANAPAMIVIDEAETVREEAPPHGAIGMSTAYQRCHPRAAQL